ncbi:unnamed protein product [[Candida] boidinii]|uniref:Unnamed protein product n=1 Tax=Candida boidinii TaxID=5477 RepID=A0ACB5U7J5_CANBO|nr:unnamed protein product [[Candida] boidinii]
MKKIAADLGYGEILKRAVSKMLPKNQLRWSRLERLKVFDGSDHPYKQNLIAFADEQPIVQKKIEDLQNRKKVLEEYEARMKSRKI